MARNAQKCSCNQRTADETAGEASSTQPPRYLNSELDVSPWSMVVLHTPHDSPTDADAGPPAVEAGDASCQGRLPLPRTAWGGPGMPGQGRGPRHPPGPDPGTGWSGGGKPSPAAGGARRGPLPSRLAPLPPPTIPGAGASLHPRRGPRPCGLGNARCSRRGAQNVQIEATAFG